MKTVRILLSNVKNNIHGIYVTLRLAVLSLMSAYWCKKHALNFGDKWKELQKLSVTKTYSVGFNHDAELGPRGFSLWVGLGGIPISQKRTKSPPIRVALTKSWHPPYKILSSPYFYWEWDIKVKKIEKIIKIFNNKMSQCFHRTLKNFLPSLHIFTRTYNW